jgi:hypothetical protein
MPGSRFLFNAVNNGESHMLRAIVAVLFSLHGVANAQVPTLADVKTRNAVQLSTDDLKQLMPSAKVVSRTIAGSTRNWENTANGALVASSDGKGFTVGSTRGGSSAGTWRIADKGTYCVTIQWSARTSEEWCRYIFKDGDKYYGFGRLEDSAQASEFEFSK